MNGSRLTYWLLGAMLAVALATSGAIYTNLSSRSADVQDEQVRHGSRLATLEAQVSYNERSMSDLKSQLTRIEAELIALRIVVAQKVR